MHAGKEKKQSSIAVGVTSTCENIATTGVKNISTACIVSSCNIDSLADSIYYWNSKKVIWLKEQDQIEWNQRYYCYHKQQQANKKLHNRGDSTVSNTIIEFDNYSQLSKYLLVKKNKQQSLLISKTHENNSSGSEEEESCCFSKQRIIYQSYRDLKRTSTQQYNTASSSSSSSSASSSSSSSFIRSQNHIRHHYRYQQQNRCILHANLKLFIYWHAFSLLACFAATGLSVRATVSKTLNSNDMKHIHDDVVADIMLLEQSSKHLTSSISSSSSSATSINDSTSIYSNPLLRHFRSTSMRLGLTLDSFCYVWSSLAPNDLCKLSPWARYQFLRKISIFNRDCLEENNIKAAQLFRLIPRYINNEADLRVQAKFLRPNVEGQACILAPTGAQQCLSCFQKIDRGLKRVEKAYEKFNLTLHRFDCMLAVDTASATRPFSPNGSCTDCKIWYRKWLIMHSLNLWSVPPCINWCYYVQLACPHLATSKVVDYAGHPSFQCRDLHIPSIHRDQDLIKLTTGTSSASKKKSTVASKCACLHPCDLEEFHDQVDTTRTAEQNRPNSYLNILKTDNEEEDFFPSAQHCMVRRHLCGSMNNEIEDHHVMRRSLTTDAEAVEEKLDNFRSNGVSSLSSYMISIASIFMRSPDSSRAVPHHQDSAIQKYFFDPVGYVSQWWTKHRARRRSQFDAKIVSTTTDSVASTATPITIGSAVVITTTSTTTTSTTTTTTTITTTISSGVAWKGTRWITCSGISIYTLYTLFFSLLLLRRPLLL